MSEKIEVGYTPAAIVGGIRPTNPVAIYDKKSPDWDCFGARRTGTVFFSTLDNN